MKRNKWIIALSAASFAILLPHISSSDMLGVEFVSPGKQIPKGKWAILVPPRNHDATGYSVNTSEKDLGNWMALPYAANTQKQCQMQATGLFNLARDYIADHAKSMAKEQFAKAAVGMLQIHMAVCGLSDGSKTFTADTDDAREKREAQSTADE